MIFHPHADAKADQAALAVAASAAPASQLVSPERRDALCKALKLPEAQDAARTLEIYVVQFYKDALGLNDVRIVVRQPAGRCVVATAAKQAGELLLYEPPFAHIIKREHFGQRCFYCARPLGAAARCSRCTHSHEGHAVPHAALSAQDELVSSVCAMACACMQALCL
jgi:hypothetical protein